MYLNIIKTWQMRLLCAFITLTLLSCSDPSREIRLQDMSQGSLRFAANMILEDIIRKDSRSPYFHLSPSQVLNPYQVLDANRVIEDFRRDYARAENAYFHLRTTGLLVQGIVSDINRDKLEVIFVNEDTSGRTSFSGRLRLSLDRQEYGSENFPFYKTDAASTFMCKEFRPLHDARTQTGHQLEIRLIECRTANDYYATLQTEIQERLKEIFSGRETVGPDLAQRLSTLYQASQSLPADSLCFSGGFLACHESLIDDLGRKWAETQRVNLGSMSISTENRPPRKLDNIRLDPALLPANANESPSGNKLDESSPQIQESREMISKTRIPSTRPTASP